MSSQTTSSPAKPPQSPPKEEREEKEEEAEILRFSPEEEATLLTSSHSQKATANKLFTTHSYSQAISTYDAALATCPNYLDYEIAVLKSNIAACHLKLSEWKEAVDAATQSLESLVRFEEKRAKDAERKDVSKSKEEENEKEEKAAKAAAAAAAAEEDDDTDEEIEEIVSEGAKASGGALPPPPPKPAKKAAATTEEDIARIRAKSLLRRARARAEVGGWSSLFGAQEDYTTLSTLPGLPATDKSFVTRQLASLPAKVEEAKNKDVAEMMAKLKTLGNSVLKPFGLSTDSFNMVKDESTGGYSMSFNQGGGGGEK